MKDATFSRISSNGRSGIANDMLRTAFISLTDQCNRNCPYCIDKQCRYKIKTRKINLQTASLLAARLSELGMDDAVITGGEPLLCADILTLLVRELHKRKITVSLITNGTLLDLEILAGLKSAGLGSIYLSSRYLDEISEGTIAVIKRNFKLSITCVLTGRDLEAAEGGLGSIKLYGAPLIVQPAYLDAGHERFADMGYMGIQVEKRMEIIRLVEKYADNPKTSYLNMLKTFSGKKENLVRPSSCHMGKNDFVVYPDGEIYPCFHRQDLSCGNIFNDLAGIILNNLGRAAVSTSGADCFGEHCLSLFF